MAFTNRMREQIKDTFIQALKEDTIPWRKQWTQLGTPFNAVTKRAYNGINNVWLAFCQECAGFNDPRWCTFKQATENEWRVKKGEHGTQVEFWTLYDKKMKKNLSFAEGETLRKTIGNDEYEKRVNLVSKVYTVFNAEQIDGIPAYEVKNYQMDNQQSIIDKRDTLVKNMKVLFMAGGDRAFYNPFEDCIHLPQMKQFESEYAYMSTLIHEAAHATGHETRMNRQIKNKFGTPDYAKEELRAEISATFTAQAMKMPFSYQEQEGELNNHKAYIQNWINRLEKDPNELFAAIKDAEVISDYLIEKGELIKEKSLASKQPNMNSLERQMLQKSQKTI